VAICPLCPVICSLNYACLIIANVFKWDFSYSSVAVDAMSTGIDHRRAVPLR